MSVIILAAGSSQRMKGTDKILEKLTNKKEVIINTICKFDEIDQVSDITVVTREDIVEKISDLTAKHGFQKEIDVIAGGSTRTQSLFLGFDFLKNKKQNNKNFEFENQFCAIHDGARPLVEKSDVMSCLDKAAEHGASALGVRINDTVKRSDEMNFVEQTVDRTNLFCVQTPQIFKFEVLDKAIENARKNNLDFTDDCQLIEAVGGRVYLSNGNLLNIKITTQKDLDLVNKILNF